MDPELTELLDHKPPHLPTSFITTTTPLSTLLSVSSLVLSLLTACILEDTDSSLFLSLPLSWLMVSSPIFLTPLSHPLPFSFFCFFPKAQTHTTYRATPLMICASHPNTHPTYNFTNSITHSLSLSLYCLSNNNLCLYYFCSYHHHYLLLLQQQLPTSTT